MLEFAKATFPFLTPAFVIAWPMNYVIEALEMRARTREIF